MKHNTTNKTANTLRTIMTAAVLSISLVSSLVFNLYTHQIQPAAAAVEGQSSKSVQLKLALRDLWVDHIVYTRNYIISFVAGLPGTNLVAERLLKNQEDIGTAIKPYYGVQAGDKLTELLKGHIMGAVQILTAAKTGNSTGAAAAERKWFDNADQIAIFLSGANPNWPKEDLTNMLHNHLALTKSEAVARLTGNYAADIAAFDKVHEQAMMMSDALADGIIKQFPDKFSSSASTTTPSSNTTVKTTGILGLS